MHDIVSGKNVVSECFTHVGLALLLQVQRGLTGTAMTDSGCYQFELDLLTSFDARSPGGADGVMSSDEGLRSFRQMIAENSVGGSAVVRVKLRHEPNAVVIADTTSGEDIEHIPFSLISQVGYLGLLVLYGPTDASVAEDDGKGKCRKIFSKNAKYIYTLTIPHFIAISGQN